MIRVAEGLGGLALVVGLGATLLSLWNTVRLEIDAVDQVRILRAELEAASAQAVVEASATGPGARRAAELVQALRRATDAVPLSTRAVVLTEVTEVETAVRGLRRALEAGAVDGGTVAAVGASLHALHDALTGARRARMDRNAVLIWSLRATAVVLLLTLLGLGARLIGAFRDIEGVNAALEERLRRRTRELRGLRGDLEEARNALHRTEARMSEAFAQATEAQRARAEVRREARPTAPGPRPSSAAAVSRDSP